MATEVSRTFDLANGCVVVAVKDQLGNVSTHTLYVTGAHAVTDVAAAVAQLLTDVDAQASALHAAMTAAGWSG